MSASVLHPQVHPENGLAIASSQVWNLPRDYSFEQSHACLKLNHGYFRGCLPSHTDMNLRSTWPNRSDDPSPISIRAPENFKEEAPSHCVRALENQLGSSNCYTTEAALLKTRGGNPQLLSCKVSRRSHDVRKSCRRPNMEEKTAPTAISSQEVPSDVQARTTRAALLGAHNPDCDSCMCDTPSQQAVFLLFWVLKRFAGLGWLLRQMRQLIGHK